MRFTMERTLTDPQVVGREFHLGLHGGSAVRQNCRTLNGEGASAGMMWGFGKEPRSRALWVLEIASSGSGAAFKHFPNFCCDAAPDPNGTVLSEVSGIL